MLSGHSWLQTSAETWLMLHPLYGLQKKGMKAPYRADWAATAVTEFLDHYCDGDSTYDDGVRAFAREIYGRALQKHGKRRFLDKTPRYTMIAPQLHRLFPEARFILLFRNPLAVLNSELETYVRGNWPKLANFNYDLLEAPSDLITARQLLGDAAISISYESLVTDPDQVIEAICKHCRIPVEEGLSNYGETDVPRGTMNDPIGVHKHTRPQTSSLDKWLNIASDAQTRHFANRYLDTLGDELIGELGYDAKMLRDSIRQVAVERKRRQIFPWELALRPQKRWTLRQRVRAARYFAHDSNGVMAGWLAAIRVVVEQFLGGLGRLFPGDEEQDRRRDSARGSEGR